MRPRRPSPIRRDAASRPSSSASSSAGSRSTRTARSYRTYDVGLGFNGLADKRFAGDNATPEGRYTIVRKIPSSLYYKALLIDYPNDEDRRWFAREKARGTIPGSVGDRRGRRDPRRRPGQPDPRLRLARQRQDGRALRPGRGRDAGHDRRDDGARELRHQSDPGQLT